MSVSINAIHRLWRYLFEQSLEGFLLIHSSTARYVFDLAFENIIKVSVVSHPSLLEKPADLEVRVVMRK